MEQRYNNQISIKEHPQIFLPQKSRDQASLAPEVECSEGEPNRCGMANFAVTHESQNDTNESPPLS